MASGHANRANRPNTWLHRPSLPREDSPCQLGAVHTWDTRTFPHFHVTAAVESKADISRTLGNSLNRTRPVSGLPLANIGHLLSVPGVTTARCGFHRGNIRCRIHKSGCHGTGGERGYQYSASPLATDL